jgi:hypothetical protein
MLEDSARVLYLEGCGDRFQYTEAENFTFHMEVENL